MSGLVLTKIRTRGGGTLLAVAGLVVLPLGAGVLPVQASNTDLAVFQPSPGMSGVFPREAAVGTTVVATGRWFSGNGWTVTSVLVGGISAGFTVVSPSQFDFAVPGGLGGPAAITVITTSGAGTRSDTWPSSLFTVVTANPANPPPTASPTSNPASTSPTPSPSASPLPAATFDLGIPPPLPTGAATPLATADPSTSPSPGAASPSSSNPSYPSNPSSSSSFFFPGGGAPVGPTSLGVNAAKGAIIGAVVGSVEGPGALPLTGAAAALGLHVIHEDPGLIPGLGFEYHPTIAWLVILLLLAAVAAALHANILLGWPRLPRRRRAPLLR